jgi:hypothetical protein
MTSSSFAQTISSGNATGHVSPAFSLKYIVKHCAITNFEISVFNPDGTRRTDSELNGNVDKPPEQTKGKKKKTVVQGPRSESSKIQFLLDQRKPPTEKLPSLCMQYDDDLERYPEMYA